MKKINIRCLETEARIWESKHRSTTLYLPCRCPNITLYQTTTAISIIVSNLLFN